MKRLLLPIAVACSMLAGCGGSSNSNHNVSVPPPVVTPPPPTTTSFTSYVITLLAQAANSLPAEINDVMLSFPDETNSTAFDSVVGSQ
ncbi:hypothetical protein ELE36_18295 [Pseudolysobacter antarcticus]|uniref:Uncharacterized protein n=1 Tax=Pseudolysobacter antarcticus TaxID=2511995 RepID=A0A411HNV6_9GAMM|nr:hypothetical protein [Pseudolysobacter antarcticus]QBB72156.1 hypothetical protein ELE36_18295 [Pseudolysobacter antarcticus]